MKRTIFEQVKQSKFDILIVLLFLILPFIMNFNVFFSVDPFPRIYAYGNDFIHNYNQLSLTTKIIHDHESILWFPLRGFGMPFLGYPLSGVLYPPAILLSIFNDPQQALLFSHFVGYLFLSKGLAAICFFFMMKSLGINRWGALIGSIVWGFNLRFDDIIRAASGAAHSLIWLPLIFLVTLRIVSRVEAKYVGYFALLIGLIYFSNYPIHFLYYLGFLVLFVIYLPFEKHNEISSRRAAGVLRFFCAVALGMGVIAVQFLPNLEYMEHWVRGSGYSLLETMIFRCKPGSFFLGYIFPETSYVERDHYIGIFPFLLVPLGLFSRDPKYRFKIFFSVIIVLTSLYTMESALSGVLQKFLYEYVPPFKDLRCPGRTLLLQMFCLAVVSGYGMDMLTGCQVDSKKSRWIVGISLLVLSAFCASAYLLPAVDGTKIVRGQSITLISASSLLMVAFLLFGKKRRRHLFPWLAVVLILVDLMYATHKKSVVGGDLAYYQKTDPNVVGTKSLITNNINENYLYLPAQEEERIGMSYWRSNYPFLFFNSIIPGLNQPNRNGYQWGLSDANHFFIKTIDNRPARSILNTRSNVEYVLPRAFIVYHLETLPRDEIMKEMCSRNFDPLNKHYIEEDLPKEFQDLLKNPGGTIIEEAERLQQVKNQCRIVEYSNDKLTIETETSQPGFLFLGDAIFPGWKAYLDGSPAKIYRTNYLFRGVPVPAGKHAIQFSYRPLSALIGLGFSVLAILIILAIFVLNRRLYSALALSCSLLMLYGHFLLPNVLQAPRRHIRSITPYHVGRAKGKMVVVHQRESQFLEWEIPLEENGVYDLVINYPPKAYALYVDNEYVTEVYNMGEDGPVPEFGVWSIQATLKLKEGLHTFKIVPKHAVWWDRDLYQFHQAFRDKPISYERGKLTEEFYRRYQIKLIKVSGAKDQQAE